METYKLIVMTNAADGRDEEFNSWYDNHHIDEILAIPGMVGAQRFRLATSKGKWRYLAIYEIEADAVDGPLTELRRRLRVGEIVLSDAMQQDDVFMSAFEPI